MYESAPISVRLEIESVHREIWAALGRPGSWWTSAQRIGIAREARRARSEHGLAQTPQGPVEATLPEVAVEAARRIGGDPATLDAGWFGGVIKSLSDTEYVELAAVVVRTVSVDVFCRGIGVALHAYPAPGPGAPSFERPATAVDEEAWIATVPSGEAGGEAGREIYGDFAMPNVIRALSLVPPDATLALRQCEAYDPRATTTPGVESGVEHGALLIEFANAVMGDDEPRLARAREGVRAVLGDAGWAEAAAIAANFNQMDRIADSTGIPLDAGGRKMMSELGREIGSVNFASAKNTLELL